MYTLMFKRESDKDISFVSESDPLKFATLVGVLLSPMLKQKKTRNFSSDEYAEIMFNVFRYSESTVGHRFNINDCTFTLVNLKSEDTSKDGVELAYSLIED